MKRTEPIAKIYNEIAETLNNTPDSIWRRKRSKQLINRLMRKFGIL